jgi:hypothetical protein
MHDPKRCSHGVSWDDECNGCNSVRFQEQCRWLNKDAEKAAAFFEANPGLASDPRVVADLYLTVARLAKIVGSIEHKEGRSND